MGTWVITNDGNSILREIDVGHPAAKSIIELARGQDEEVGDGTTSVVVLAGELLSVLEKHVKDVIHPHILISGLRKALDDALKHLETIKKPINNKDDSELLGIIKSAIGTKFLSKWSDLIAKLALDAVRTICTDDGIVDLKRQLRIERIPGGEIEDSYVMRGTMINKDVDLNTRKVKALQTLKLVVKMIMPMFLQKKKLKLKIFVMLLLLQDVILFVQKKVLVI